eukprot:2708288-Karenia_brevis.AAC.1
MVLEPVVHEWARQRRGVAFGDGRLVNHAIWADNILTFASSFHELQQMSQKLTDAIARVNLHWKKDSLQFIVCGTATVDNDAVLRVAGDDCIYDYKR